MEENNKTSEAKLKITFEPCGVEGSLIYESITFKEKPALLVYSTAQGKFTVESELRIEGKRVLPLTREMFPYCPYDFSESLLEEINRTKQNPRELYDLVLQEFRTFIDLESRWRAVEAVQTLESYIQHKMQTTSYLFHYGDVESGKSRILEIHNALDYRPLLSPSLPPADVYTYLGYHSEGCGTILEDEAEDLRKRRYEEKMKLYRVGYRKGATVPRIEFTNSGRRAQRFYKAFCCKCFSGRYLPNDAAFQARCIPINMVSGIPDKDEILDEDYERFNEIRCRLLAWRMESYFEPLPEVNVNLFGRLKEIWKPKLQVASIVGRDVADTIRELALEAWEEKQEQVRDSLEAYLTRAVIQCWLEIGSGEITFAHIWDKLREVLGAEEDLENPQRMITDFGTITKHSIGSMLSSVLGGKRKRMKRSRLRTYIFDAEKLEKLAKKYGISLGELVKGEDKANAYPL